MSEDPIDRLRAHVEKHKGKVLAPFSIAGLTTLLGELDRLQGALATCRELREYDVKVRDALKAQVDRMLATRAKVLTDVLTHAGQAKKRKN
jgi:hypothetical protein